MNANATFTENTKTCKTISIKNNICFRYKEDFEDPQSSLRIRRETEQLLDRDNHPLNKAMPIFTPDLRKTGVTMHSTNAKGRSTGYKGDVSPVQYLASTVKSDNSSYMRRRYANENHSMGQREEMDPRDSINDRILTPEKAYDDNDQFRTPNVMNRIKAYAKVNIINIPSSYLCNLESELRTSN